MSIAEKLKQVAENEQKVYDAGYAKGQADSVSMRGTYVINESPSVMYELDFEYPVGGTYYYYNGTSFVKGELKKISLYYDEDYGDGFIRFEGSGSDTGYWTNDGWRSNGIHSSDNEFLRTITITDDLTGALLRTWLKANATFTPAPADGFEEGKQSERTAFWGVYLSDGSLKRASYMFSEPRFGSANFYPTRDICPVGRAQNLFYNFGAEVNGVKEEGFDLRERLRECGVSLDLSQATNLVNCFAYTRFTGLPALDFTGCGSETIWVFENMFSLTEIDGIKVDADNVFSGWFTNCTDLREVRFSGIIAHDIDLHWSKKLSRESFNSVFNAADESIKLGVPSFIITFSLVAVNNAYDGGIENNDWKNQINNTESYYRTVAVI